MKRSAPLRLALAALLTVAALLSAVPAQAAAPTPAPSTAKPELVVHPDGSWEIRDPDNVNYPISYCAGTSHGPKMIGTLTLEFGAQQTCDNARDWPHRVVVWLQSTCSDFWCIVFDDEGYMDTGWVTGRVATKTGGLGCDNTNRRKYRLVVDVYARGTYLDTVVGSNEPVLSCSM
ncbi:hypothetical protein GA0074692_2574 [Micromonospora pallida]|uniref:Peptidase inhibitor family I36 n=1 Tax=Micromonospora pallida TaxID=145854 RepID=A0A1C6SGM1_9ACTN|nr:hypothetical protein [Micromonospora pallida]SCL28621.1 hypothetical protein GA0074692_2574 [Micromonospora pallida]